MPDLDFTLEQINSVEFGVGHRENGKPTFGCIPVDDRAQGHLRLSLAKTWQGMIREDDSKEFDPADQLAATAYLYLDLCNPMASLFRNLQNAENIPSDSTTLSNMDHAFCYFARFTDRDSKLLTALRRATQFKSLRKQSGNLFWQSDTLELELSPTPVFRLNAEFDLILDSKMVHILHPKGFVALGDIEGYMLSAVADNIDAITPHLDFVNLEPIEEYACDSIRAAAYIASIKAQQWAQGFNKATLMEFCWLNGIEVAERDQKIDVPRRHILDFLQILDRRRYEFNLAEGPPEYFKATNRQQIR